MGRAEEIFARIVDQGEAALDEFIDARASEELFLDFKRSADHARGSALHQNDRSNLEKAVSGFGNSEGGVIVWGVDCSRNPAMGDVASAKMPIEQPTRYKSWLENATSGVTVPAHGGVRHHAVLIADDTGFVVTLIPMSHHAPHQTANDRRYYMRAGSSFLPMPHAILAGMFGRRPNPNIWPTWVLSCFPVPSTNEMKLSIGVSPYNDGPGIAEDVFVNINVASLPGANCKIEFTDIKDANWFGDLFFGHQLSIILRNGLRLPPKALILATTITMRFRPPFNNPLRLTGSCGCSGSPTFPILVERDPTVIHSAYNHAIDLAGTQYINLAGKSFQDRVFPGGSM